MEEKMVLGAWITEDDLADMCSDLGVALEDALDNTPWAELQSELNQLLIEMVWDSLNGDENESGV